MQHAVVRATSPLCRTLDHSAFRPHRCGNAGKWEEALNLVDQLEASAFAGGAVRPSTTLYNFAMEAVRMLFPPHREWPIPLLVCGHNEVFGVCVSIQAGMPADFPLQGPAVCCPFAVGCSGLSPIVGGMALAAFGYLLYDSVHTHIMMGSVIRCSVSARYFFWCSFLAPRSLAGAATASFLSPRHD